MFRLVGNGCAEAIMPGSAQGEPGTVVVQGIFKRQGKGQ